MAITLAPALQRWAWLFPMPGTRRACPELGAYEGIHAEAALADLAGRDRAAMAHAREIHSHAAVADCLSATTTQWLPVYAAGAAVPLGLSAWFVDRARAGKPVGHGRPAPWPGLKRAGMSNEVSIPGRCPGPLAPPAIRRRLP